MEFEHSVANMYFIPAGIMAMQQADLVTLIGESLDLTNMTLSSFFVTNLLPVTLGNILGGSVFVALFYWFIYLQH
ncbi:MAG: formate/nitrite transporter family protein [Gammaproteobacteria bacterium]|nr:formate/nitrite transporter family protein [Gammaproteobacteria bacterium]